MPFALPSPLHTLLPHYYTIYNIFFFLGVVTHTHRDSRPATPHRLTLQFLINHFKTIEFARQGAQLSFGFEKLLHCIVLGSPQAALALSLSLFLSLL